MVTGSSASTDPSSHNVVVPPESTSTERFTKLWKQAVDDYEKTARLSDREKVALRRHYTSEDAFNLTKLGWEKNITDKKKWRHHETVAVTMSQVLAVFGLIGAGLNVASMVIPPYLYKPQN